MAHFKRLPPKKTIYRDYKMFHEARFLHDLDKEMIKGSVYHHENSFAVFHQLLEMWLIDMHLQSKGWSVKIIVLLRLIN